MSKKGKDGDDERMFTDADLAALTKDGLTAPLADALQTIADALRANVAAGAVDTPSKKHPRPMTIHSTSRGLHLTLVINARRDDADSKEH